MMYEQSRNVPNIYLELHRTIIIYILIEFTPHQVNIGGLYHYRVTLSLCIINDNNINCRHIMTYAINHDRPCFSQTSLTEKSKKLIRGTDEHIS